MAIVDTQSPVFQLLLARMNRIEKGYLLCEDGHEMTDDNLKTLNEALVGCSPKDKSYRPYCLRCREMPRVFLRHDGTGFECPDCQNHFGFDLKAISPKEEGHPY